MIERYSTPEMRHIWSPHRRWEIFLDVELAYLDALEEDGIAPAGGAERIRETVKLDPGRIEELEATLRHDVIAFLAHVEEQAGDATAFMHYGMTSSDALDTVTGLQLKEAAGLIRQRLVELESALWSLADGHRETTVTGRTHGMHAEATSFGLLVLGWREAVCRGLERFDGAVKRVAVGKFSGAVGNLAFGDPDREVRVLKRLGLEVEPVATQVVARDRHAEFFSTLAVIGGTLEQIAVNIRHMQRSEVGEVHESFGGGQRGSSAMPHKKNPIDSENVTGQSRLLRSYALASLENIALWHERDISHSSVERMIGPDATATMEFTLRRLTRIVTNLVVHEDRMSENLAGSGGLVFSEGVLLALVRKGLKRQDAYGYVQRAALKAAGDGSSFEDNLVADAEVRALLSEDEIRTCFSVREHLKFRDAIFERRTRSR
ncbi:MAG: adenylosuccinate lyase [Deltaproteobacteria bacterium]|nr:adenylosuccinate lyase [Deltaproteobacteria bacterium]